MSRKPASPYTRRPTRHPGISYRERANGGRTYFVTVGSRHVRVEGGEKEALLAQAQLRSNKGRGLRVTPPKTTFGELAQVWVDRNRSRWALSTLTGYEITLSAHLLPEFGSVPLASITTDHIAAFIAKRRRAGASEAYISANLRPLNGVFKLALRQGLITANPMTSLLSEERPKPKKRKRHAWTPQEIERLIDAARELGSRVGQVYDYSPFIVVAIFTGMRVGELLGLRWEDVDLKNKVIRVRHQLCRDTRTLIPPKTAAGIRDIPIPDSLVTYIREYRLRSTFSLNEHLVFCSRTGSPLDHGNVRRRGFHAAVEAAGLNRPGEPKLTVHDLRHAYASVVAHHGISSVDLAVVMGHGDSRVTEKVYLHPYDELSTAERLRAVVDAAIGEHLAGPKRPLLKKPL